MITAHLKRDEIPPYAGLVGRLDLVIQMVKNDVINILVPGENFSDLTKSSLAHLNSKNFVLDEMI